MLNPTLRRWAMGFCLAAAFASYVAALGFIDNGQVIWLLLLCWPVIAGFGEWQFRLGQKSAQL